ncbi:MAG TPA: SWIM zinc finger family protein [Leptolyngbya sp.]|jgi:hypothetical protein|nr:SWIM zinc finger family protein [Leptolyngbya sp.]
MMAIRQGEQSLTDEAPYSEEPKQSVHWKPEQVLALAPDAASARNGQALASLRKWTSLGSASTLIWGECQGSGKTPYRTQVDLSEPAFRCSCPSRKFPCKHGLGLFLIWAEQSDRFERQELPQWVAEWAASRSQRAQQKSEKQAQPREQAVDPVAQEKRSTARHQKVSAGIQELRVWLEDRVRQGLAAAQPGSDQIWDQVAARMVDAQAPGLARQLRECAGITGSGSIEMGQLLARLGQLYLVTEGFQRIDTLAAEVQTDLRTRIGWAMNQENVLSGEVRSDLWLVVGQQIETDDRLKVRRVWLLGLNSDTFALLLDFAPGHQSPGHQSPGHGSFEQSFLPGTCIEAELAFYPSAYPLRALIKSRHDAIALSKQPPGKTIAQVISIYHHAFAKHPWLEQFPILLNAVVPIRESESRWLIRDAEGAVLPLSPPQDFNPYWQLLALSGGHPIAVFGEWNGTDLLPLNVWTEETVYAIGSI